MSYYGHRRKQKLFIGKDNNALITLIAINLIAFVVFSFVMLLYWANNGQEVGRVLYKEEVQQWLALPADPLQFIQRPWTLITYAFMHEGVWHILGNMLWLWAFGHILRDIAGGRHLVPLFVYGAFAGAAIFIVSFNIIPALHAEMPFSRLVGASAGVMGVAAATTLMAPDYRIFPQLNGGIPLWVITIIFLIIDLATIPNDNAGGHIAHLAGAAMGCVYVLFLRRGYEPGAWMLSFFDWVNDLFKPEDKPTRRKEMKDELFYKSGKRPFSRTAHLTQQRIDEILDKINQRGYNHLTEEEKELLKRASQEDL